MPTIQRLPAMVQATGVNQSWMDAAEPVVEWHAALSGAHEELAGRRLEDLRTGPVLVRVIGYCADMAAWIRTNYHVGD
jgi:hypothetical protein